MRYDISYDPERGRWYLDASWKTTPNHPDIEELRPAALGVDLNDGHLACCVLDTSGNPIGEPVSIDVVTAGCVRPGVMDGCGQRSPPCSIMLNTTRARRS